MAANLKEAEGTRKGAAERVAGRAPAQLACLRQRVRTQQELESLRGSAQRGRPFGGESWQRRGARQLGIESALRSRGRPRKDAAG